jgi:hypothetical protein
MSCHAPWFYDPPDKSPSKQKLSDADIQCRVAFNAPDDPALVASLASLGAYVVESPPTPEEMAGLYLDMSTSGQLRKVFHQAEPDLRWFLDWVCAPDSIVIGAWRTEPKRTFLGCGFLNNLHQMNSLVKGDVGFAFMDSTAPLSLFAKAHLVGAMIDWVFQNTRLESVCGLTPEPNGGAVGLVKRVGLRLFGPIPNYTVYNGKPCAAYISQMDAATWMNRKGKRRLGA